MNSISEYKRKRYHLPSQIEQKMKMLWREEQKQPFRIVIIYIFISACSSWMWLSESYSYVFKIILCEKICKLPSVPKAHFCHFFNMIFKRDHNVSVWCQLSYLFIDGDLEDKRIWSWKPHSRATRWYKYMHDQTSERLL